MPILDEKYQLTCCSTGKALEVNGLPAVFLFKGEYSNGHHPDTLLESVLTAIRDINGNIISGCFKVEEAGCFEEYQELAWEDIFIDVECVETCAECLPLPEVILPLTNHKLIYPEFIVNNVDSNEAESIFCTFGDAMYQKVLALRYGVQFCCPVDLQQAQIELEILKMDIATDVKACCPVLPSPLTCKKYIITIPSGIEGYLYFKNCLGNKTIVSFSEVNTPYQTYVCGITLQTSASIYILADNLIVPVQFTESTTSCL